jgi:hypothetical protein
MLTLRNLLIAVAIAMVVVGPFYAQDTVKKVCACQLTGECTCKVCECALVSVQDKVIPKYPNQTVTCSTGYKVEFAYNVKLGMYCPCEKGWMFCPDTGLWLPPQIPTVALTAACDPGFIHTPYSTYAAPYGQFQGSNGASGACAGGSCGTPSGGTGRVGLFGRRR